MGDVFDRVWSSARPGTYTLTPDFRDEQGEIITTFSTQVIKIEKFDFSNTSCTDDGEKIALQFELSSFEPLPETYTLEIEGLPWGYEGYIEPGGIPEMGEIKVPMTRSDYDLYLVGTDEEVGVTLDGVTVQKWIFFEEADDLPPCHG